MDRSEIGVQDLLDTLERHGLMFILESKEDVFDDLQVEYLLQCVNDIQVLEAREGYPSRDIPGVYSGVKKKTPRQRQSRMCRVLSKTLRKQKQNAVLTSTSTDSDSIENGEESSVNEEYNVVDDFNESIETTKKRAKHYHDVKNFLPKHNIQKPPIPGSGPTSAILSNVARFRCLLEKLLEFHSFIHYFENVPVADRSNHKKIRQGVMNMVELFTSIIYRGDSTIDCNTGKIHSHLHLADDIRLYGHPMNWECSKGERGLKTWAKTASKTAQKQNLGTFMQQTATRVWESLLLRNALKSDPLTPLHDVHEVHGSEEGSVVKPGVRKHPHYQMRIITSGAIELIAISQKGSRSLPLTNVEEFIHPLMIKSLQNLFGSEVPADGIKIYKDAKISLNGSIQPIRAFSNYDKDGSFFDWVMITWKLGRNNFAQAPAKVLLIFEDKEGEISVLVQSCFWQSREDVDASTEILARWRLEFNNETVRSERVIRTVKLKEISGLIYVLQHFGKQDATFGIDEKDDDLIENSFVDVMEPRYAWAHLFLNKIRNS